jgi:hypothetical protein
MAFFDKLTAFTKAAGEKTGEVMELTKLNIKISTEKAAIEEAKLKIGEHYWDRYEAGQPLDEEVSEFCQAIEAAKSNIEEIQAEIKLIKSSKAQQDEGPDVCAYCAAELDEGANYCSNCGAKVE